MRYATWVIVASVTLLRGLAAWKVPLTGDEAYYWEWAKHLALGYADHPPMVAYLIFPFDWVTANPFWIRIGFLLCGVVATLAAAATAKRITGNERAGMVTALAMTLTPMLSVGFVLATPDGPLMAGWAVCLYLAVRASQTHARRDYVLLGVAIAFALLAKMFAFALVAGIVAWALMPARRALWREGLGLSFGVAAVLYAPFVVWNASTIGSASSSRCSSATLPSRRGTGRSRISSRMPARTRPACGSPRSSCSFGRATC